MAESSDIVERGNKGYIDVLKFVLINNSANLQMTSMYSAMVLNNVLVLIDLQSSCIFCIYSEDSSIIIFITFGVFFPSLLAHHRNVARVSTIQLTSSQPYSRFLVSLTTSCQSLRLYSVEW
jgi:hypothetical protein